MRLLSGQLRKLVHRPATRYTPVFLGGMLLLVYVGVAASRVQVTDPGVRADLEAQLQFPGVYELLAQILLTMGGIAAATYAGMVRGSDWSWRTFGAVVARGESRSRYVLTEYLGIALLVTAAFVVLMAFGTILAGVGALFLGLGLGGAADTDALANLASTIVRGSYAMAIQASFGVAAAAVTRSPLAGVVVIVTLLIGEQIAPIVIPPDVMAYAPLMTTMTIALGSSGSPGETSDLIRSLLVGTAYGAVALLIATAASIRAELE